MRNLDVLYSLDDIAIFYQYLYSDKDHKISFNNGMHGPFEATLVLQMDEDLHITCGNTNFPDLPALSWDSDMYPANILGIIEKLKTQPAENFPQTFANRWEEIKQITLDVISLNKCKNFANGRKY